MKKNLKIVIGIFCGIIVVAIGSLILLNILNDENKLTVDEKKWINSNLSTVQNVNVVNDLDVFGSNGKGVFFDFINDLASEYGLKINPVTYTNSTENTGFVAKNILNTNDVVMYEDNYVLIHDTYELLMNNQSLANKKIGVLESDYSYLNSYLSNIEGINLKQYNNSEELVKAFKETKEIDYLLVPKYYYVTFLVENNYNIVYHFTDIKKYYVYQMQENDYFGQVVKKYYKIWQEKKQEKSYNKALNNILVKGLKLTEAEINSVDSKIYTYGFINNSPYEVIMGGNYGGIVSVYLKRFSDVTGVDFKFVKYRTYKLLNKAINEGNVDLYFNYYLLNSNYTNVNSLMNINYYIIAKDSNNLVVNSLQSLKNKTVYVLQDSLLSEYLKNVDNITIKTYSSNKELEKLVNKDVIIMLDQETYKYLANKELAGYNIRYSEEITNTYSFKLKSEDAFYRLFNEFIKLQDPKDIVVNGLYNHTLTVKSGTILGTIAKYIIYVLLIALIILYAVYKSAKRIKISKKIKKTEKIRYIDQLTSLKNRNYLNESISGWNKNTIYPQATIIVDLNKLQEINDTLGYEQGDKQIKAAANVLIKTQLDNSDIIRTDGNEFLIYLVGYEEKQIASYIRKLNKEFKNLPYDYGAKIGYSMITNDLKTVEDAINEAVEDMKRIREEEN